MARLVQSNRFDKKPHRTNKHCHGKRPWLARVRNKVLEYAYNLFYVRHIVNKVRSSPSSRFGYNAAAAANDDWWWNNGRWRFWDKGSWWGDYGGVFWRQKTIWIKHPRS
jgi:hypothetical protein